MQSLANRLAIQHFVNAYTQETGKGYLLHKNQQTSTQQAFSQGLTLLILPIHSIQAQCYFPFILCESCRAASRSKSSANYYPRAK
jgi:hypothetical protein